MNSLISLLWQFEIPNIPIVPTILKNQHQQAHHYFYSQKQNKVLRKKNPNAISLIQQSQKPTSTPLQHNTQHKNKQPTGSLILKINRNQNIKNKTICMEVCDSITAISQIQNKEYQGQYSIVQDRYQLCLCKYRSSGKSSNNEKYRKIQRKDIEIQHLTCQKPQNIYLEYPKKQQQIITYIQHILNYISIHVTNKNQQLKKQQMKQIRNSNYSSGNSVRQLEIVVAVDLALLGTQNKGTSVGAIVVVDAVRLEFLYAVDCFSGILYEVGEMGSGNKSKIKGIGYRNSNKRNIQNKDMPKLITQTQRQLPKIQQKQTQYSQQQCLTFGLKPKQQPKDISIETSVDRSKQQQNVHKDITKGIHNMKIDKQKANKQKHIIQCSSCGVQVQEGECKEIDGQDMKMLRKRNGMSIRGFNQEYYLVCQQCYLSL